MIKIFDQPSQLEKIAKETFSVPEFIMMENAARGLSDKILQIAEEKQISSFKTLIFCGKGNNGADGYALARLLQSESEILIFSYEEPASMEAIAQATMCQKLKLPITRNFEEIKNFQPDFIVDCLYGTGFRGELKSELIKIFDFLNDSKAIKVACDIPSGLYFNANYTVTMGELKSVLYSDKAKSVCGKISVVNLGISSNLFVDCMNSAAFLLEKQDIKLPLRTNKAAHKGTYGHTTVFAGEKAGAGIIAATAAMNFGCGLTTLLKTQESNLEQFKISPELMLSTTVPEKTTAIVIGPGLNCNDEQSVSTFEKWFSEAKEPAAVLDAGILSYNKICPLLEKINRIPNARIILTPHLSELSRFLQNLKEYKPEIPLTEEHWNIKNLANSTENKIYIGKLLNEIFPKTVIVMKSANTFIAAENNIYICQDGVPSLAKGGSGDVLAGMAGALLAQNYSAKAAAITAVETHALAASSLGEAKYDLTPEKLISQVSFFHI